MFPGAYAMPDLMGWWMAVPALVLVAVCSIALYAIARLAWRHDDPRGLLDERLARGEIDGEEYRARRTLLEA
jgi:uncharacterized membrane protein